jgi:hypothetical protein
MKRDRLATAKLKDVTMKSKANHPEFQKYVWLLIALLIGFCGCGGGHSTLAPSTALQQRGTVRVVVVWPNSRATRDIPDTAKFIQVDLVRDNSVLLTQVIARPGASTTFTDVITGPATLRAKAFSDTSADGSLVASGEQQITVTPNATDTQSLTLTRVPPPVLDPAYVIGGSVAPDESDAGLIQITLSALINKADGTATTGLTADNFQVLEDGLFRGPLSVTATSGTKSKADVAFVIDTTASMSPEIGGVRDSVVALVDNLASHLDIRLAGVSFGDDVRDIKNFTSDSSDFKTWVDTLNADGGGDVPENPLDAIATAVDSQISRPDAQHIIIAITDAPAHTPGDGGDATVANTLDGIIAHLRGNYVVYCISPGTDVTRSSVRPGRQASDSPRASKPPLLRKVAVRSPGSRDTGVFPDIKPIAAGTGGIWLRLPSDGAIDLGTLPIGATLLNGYVVQFPAVRTNKDHSIRLLVTTGGSFVAEQTFKAHY